jgi:hypothetical protein
MLAAIAVVLLAVWLVAVVTAHVFGGLIHVLLAVAVLALAWQAVVSVNRAVRRHTRPPF